MSFTFLYVTIDTRVFNFRFYRINNNVFFVFYYFSFRFVCRIRIKLFKRFQDYFLNVYFEEYRKLKKINQRQKEIIMTI